MIKNFINEAETFAVNENLEIQVKNVGDTEYKYVVVDNFYKNPEKVRELSLMIPPTTNERILTNLPSDYHSGRINAFYIMDPLGPVFEKIFKEGLPEIFRTYPPGRILESFRDATFMVNVMSSENLPPRLPHMDFPADNIFASLIYLNTPEECAGGTGFYSFNGQMKGFAHSVNADGTGQPDHFVTDDLGDWKLVDMVEMKWNRMVMYPQSIYHSAYIKPGMFTGDNYRLNQIFFI